MKIGMIKSQMGMLKGNMRCRVEVKVLVCWSGGQ
jgi:hypothetical protein